MDQETRTEVREAMQRLRRPPGDPVHIRATVDGGGEIGEDVASGPIELTVEVTDADGEPAVWFDDQWWTTLIERWADEPLTVHIAPTPTALLHPLTLYQLEMLRRVVPGWRIVGHAYADDVTSDDDVQLLAASAYDQVRFLDSPRSDPPQSDRCRSRSSIEELFGRIRREQARLGVSRPTLVRLPSTAPTPSPTPTARVQSRATTT